MSAKRRHAPAPIRRPPARKAYLASVTASLNPPSVADEVEMMVSTSDVDRDGDRVMPSGMRADAYLRNPVLMWAHTYSALPIGTVTHLEAVGEEGVKARFRWLENDEQAARVRNAWEQGVVRAASIGFRPLTWKETATGYDLTGWELLEVSLVPVPSNPEAVRMLKGLGLVEADWAGVSPEPEPVEQPAETWVQTTTTTADVLPCEEKAVSPPDVPMLTPETTKVGRVLSGANEARLQQALALLTDVLNQLVKPEEDEDEDDDDEEPMAEATAPVAAGCGSDERKPKDTASVDVGAVAVEQPADLSPAPSPPDSERGLADLLAELRPLAATAPPLQHLNLESPMVRALFGEAVRAALLAAIRDQVAVSTSAAFDRLRGRVR